MEVRETSYADRESQQGQTISADPTLASLEQVWSPFMPLLQDAGIAYDGTTDEFVNMERQAADAAREMAATRKDNFFKLMAAWDAEHDKTVADLATQKHRNPFTRKTILLAEIRSNITDTHSWKDVFDLVNNAKDGYDNPTGTAVLRKWVRKTAGKAEFIEPFVGFIPESEYTSVICAGLKFIIGACKATKKFQEEVFDLISQLPEKVEIVSEYSELYNLDAKLQRATNELYCDILWAMEGLIYWLTKDHTFEWLKPLLQQSSYGPLREKIEKVAKSSKQVENAVQLCDSKKISEIGRKVDDMGNDILKLFRAHFIQAKWLDEFRMLITNLLQEQANGAQETQAQSYISKQELLSLLYGSVEHPDTGRNTPEAASSEMTQKVLRMGFSMDSTSQARSKWLMANKTIGRWFRSATSRTLLVNGNGTMARMTPISFFCAILIHSLTSVRSVVILSHFCGLASSEASDNKTMRRPGSSGLLRDLLMQLLYQWEFGELKCISKGQLERLESTASELTVREERRLFRKLVTALPMGQPLFIIIDGINYYETSEFKAETKEVIAEINALLNNEEGALIKVLVTSTTRSFEVNEYFEEEDERLDMPSNISQTMVGFADTQFDLKLGKDVARLKKDRKHEGTSA